MDYSMYNAQVHSSVEVSKGKSASTDYHAYTGDKKHAHSGYYNPNE